MIKKQVTNLAWYSIALMVLTSLHHIYGAFIYNTPWRLHVLFISVPVIALTFLLQWTLVKNGSANSQPVFWLFILLILVPSIGMIAMFEGLYNHALKNILFFGGASVSTLEFMFPAPTYEMPNDFAFEITGVLQGFFMVPLLIYLAKAIRSYPKGSV